MKKLIVVVILILSTGAISAQEEYTPLTEEQALMWLQMISNEQLVQLVIRYDYLEHSNLYFQQISWGAVVEDDGTVTVFPVFPEGQDYQMARVGLDDRYSFLYSVQMPVLKFPQLVPEAKCPKWRWGLIGGGIGFTLGVVVTLLVLR